MASLRRGNAGRLYLLSGEESYYIDKVRKAVLKAWGCQRDDIQVIDEGAGIGEIMGAIESAPFFADKNVIIIRSAALFKEKKGDAGEDRPRKLEKSFLELLQDLPDFSYVIFEYHGKADKRKKLYKVLDKAGIVLEADAIRASNIGDWLEGKLQEMNKNMNRDAYEYFVGAISSMQTVDLGFLSRELDKLAMFMGHEERQITKEKLLLVFSDVPEISSFAMLNAIGEGNTARALQLFRRQMENGVYFALIVGLLARQIRLWWQAGCLLKRGIRGRALAGHLGQPPFIAEKTGREAAGFPPGVLKRALVMLSDADYGLKTGQGDIVELEAVIIVLGTRGRDGLL